MLLRKTPPKEKVSLKKRRTRAAKPYLAEYGVKRQGAEGNKSRAAKKENGLF